MTDLENVRRAIDAVDRELLALFAKRLSLVDQVAASKRESGAPVEDAAREGEILARVARDAGPRFASEAKDFFSAMLSISKARQRSILGERARGEASA